MMHAEDVYGVPGQQTGLITCWKLSFTGARANVTGLHKHSEKTRCEYQFSKYDILDTQRSAIFRGYLQSNPTTVLRRIHLHQVRYHRLHSQQC